VSRRLLLVAGGGSSTLTPPPSNWTIEGADDVEANLAATIAGNAFSVIVGGITEAVGTRPAAFYNALWTRDHAYVLWHYPELFTAAERRQFVAYYLERRTDGTFGDPRGGPLPADFVPDYIDGDGDAVYRNALHGQYPIFDGIHMAILALWADWHLTGATTTYDDNQGAIDDCLAAIPRSVSGCVWSDPADPTQDYGFTDSVRKTGDVAYGTALQAWAYKMLDEISGGGSSTAEGDTYANLRAAAEAGLATLRSGSGWYMGSSGSDAAVDDVWATALIVAEGLVAGTDRTDSAQAILDAYNDGATIPEGYTSTITEFGLVRHLPVGQYWAVSDATADTYQNGGYWATPLWDCVRAVDLIDPVRAREWAAEYIAQLNAEFAAEGTWANVPYEWHNFPGGVGAKGYTPHAALVHRFV